MGLLSNGTPMTWDETKKYADHVRHHGVQQFINIYKRIKDRKGDVLKWGDEIEYSLVRLNAEAQTAHVLIKAGHVLKVLKERCNELNSAWSPEYGGFIVEGTPSTPYGGSLAQLNTVEANMRLRRQELRKILDEQMGEVPLTITAFPRLGCDNSTHPTSKPNTSETGVSKSIFVSDDVISKSHPRFITLTRNIRKRRGEKICINVPIYKDVNTASPFIEDFPNDVDGEATRSALADHIYMDAMGFGMTIGCLQMTFQGSCIEEAKHLYDQLNPVCPIMMALSVSCPFFRGYVSDIDCRWSVIAASVDDRTEEERGMKKLVENKHRISKSRFGSVDCYLSESNDRYNDVDLTINSDAYKLLRDAGVARCLARHISHLFIRDTVSLFSERVHQDDTRESDHFENIQSTNWQTLRFKPPPANSPNIGWRVEFRPMDVQLTDFENAAYDVFMVLVTRIILSFQLNFLIPISKVDENLLEAEKRDAVLNGKFYFRSDVHASPESTSDVHHEYELMDINTIINGGQIEGGSNFPGIIPLINMYLASTIIDVDTRYTISIYLNLISDRASGKLKTTARWMRDYVDQHPDYKHDSVITEKINYDLLTLCNKITKGEHHPVELFHTQKSRTNYNNTL